MTRSLPLTPAESLERTRAAASPRLPPVPTPWASLAIHAAAAALLVAACAGAVLGHGLAAWAPGLVYVGYDALVSGLVLATMARSAASPGPVAARPSLAVVVAAHDEAAALPSTIEALLAQSEAPDFVLVADDGSRDETAARLAHDFALTPPPLGTVAASETHPTLRWLRLPHGGKARALNAALLALEIDVVLTVDADTRVAPGAVGAFRAAFAADPRLVAAGGILRPACATTRLGRWLQAVQQREYARNTLAFAAWARLDMLLHIPGALAGYRRDALVAVGGFDPDGLTEDYELIHRLRRHDLGWTTGLVAAYATTDAPATLPAFLRQRRRWFCGFLQTQLRYRDMVGAARDGRVGRLMLPIKAFDTLQPLHGLLALALLPALALRGHWGVLAIAGGALAGKAMIDVLVRRRAARLAEGKGVTAGFGAALATTTLGLFSFEILRHLGAALGWITFLTGDRVWRPQDRDGGGG